MKKIYTIDEIKEIVAPIAEKYGIENVFLFGSYARGNANGKSDIDLRVDRGNAEGFKYLGFINEIEESLRKRTDVLTTEMLSSEFLFNIKNEEIAIYEAK